VSAPDPDGRPLPAARLDAINHRRMDSPTWRYQAFHFRADGSIHAVGGWIPLKLEHFGDLFPRDLTGKSVIDVGCHLGYWCFEAASRGAVRTLGFDSSADLPDGWSYIDLDRMVADAWPRYRRCRFEELALGSEESLATRFEPADLVFCCDVYHHCYRFTPDHDRLFAWLAAHVAGGGTMIWQNPIELDPWARETIPQAAHAGYTEGAILAAARRHFREVELRGPSLHARSRILYRMRK
jgi:SAM-dependent methyltransferase